MPIDLDKQIEMVPVDTGDMSEIPPDMPEGHWRGTANVRPWATKEDKYPMLIVEWTSEEALTEGNEDKVGLRGSDFIVIYPKGHAREKDFKVKVKAIADLYPDLPPLDTSSLGGDAPDFSSVVPWVEALESEQREFWTSNRVDKKTGEVRTNFHYRQPGKKVEVASVEETEGDEPKAAEEPEPEKPKAKVTANGHAKTKSKKK